METREDMSLLHPGWDPGRRRQDRRRPRRGATVAVLVLVAVAAVVALLPFRQAARTEDSGREPAFPAETLSSAPTPVESRPPTGNPEWDAGSPQVPPAVLPTPVRPATAAPATAEAPACRVDDLSLVVHGWSTWLGANGTTTLTATNRTSASCLLGGWPELRLEQGGRPLALTMQQSATDLDHREVPVARLLLAPGTSASSTLWWRGYGTAADHAAPQRLTVRLGDVERRLVPLPGDPAYAPDPDGPDSPAPFDLIDGGTISLTPWRPAAW
ncbi:DUF4232 domain-containing protein [Mobilicoccus pelagius]|uniref:DUF4232 domain-containing protein n=1 Tax=Mobilicoccus pelagius TaxID=746032 RepID=UPI0002FB2CD2|nr:DUF4232 domain-containing protein [Mobilicoccus pelagius]